MATSTDRCSERVDDGVPFCEGSQRQTNGAGIKRAQVWTREPEALLLNEVRFFEFILFSIAQNRLGNPYPSRPSHNDQPIE